MINTFDNPPEVPGRAEALEPYSILSAEKLTCGIRFLTDFWREKYFQEFIRNGGSKIKFICGRQGSGKTHFLRLITSIAREENYKTVQFSAKDIWMHDFKEIYIEFSVNAILWNA